MNSSDDVDELIRRCQRGDEAALAEIVRRYQKRIYQMAQRVTGDACLAEDATADTFWKIWRKAGQWRGQTNAGGWIYRIAVHNVLDLCRRRRRQGSRGSAASLLTIVDGQLGPSEVVERAEDREHCSQRVRRELACLSESDRALVHLYYFEGQSLAEIAAVFGVARESVKMRLSRARTRLRGVIENHDGA